MAKATREKSAKKTTSRKTSASRATKTSPASAESRGKSLKPGDKVAWGTSQGRTTGRVVKKQTSPTQIKTHKVAASKRHPEYIVESEKSGKRAAHKPGELRKV